LGNVLSGLELEQHAGAFMARDTVDETPITTRNELVAFIEQGVKGDAPLRIGTEHEKFPFSLSEGFEPVAYEGRGGIRALLDAFIAQSGWEPILEHGKPIGLADPVDGSAISLEPGGQFELSGGPLLNLHETAEETRAHLRLADAVGKDLGMGFLLLGASPVWSRSATPIMPKSRYAIMMNYMPKVGTRGLDMMFRTCTVQVNLDFRTEADMVKKLRTSIALQPIATAIFANSPFMDGKPTGYLSTRSAIWLDTDKDRTGMLPFVFEDGFGFERYVDYAIDVPTYFVKRGDHYHDVAGQSFRALLQGKMPGLHGEFATASDWANHLTTIFPEVRLKRYLEMRGADVGPEPMIVALSAFWTGLLYHTASLDGAWDIAKHWTAEERQNLRDAVPKQALSASIGGRSVKEIATDLLALSEAGLKARSFRDRAGADETQYLEPLKAIIAGGKTQAQFWLDHWRYSTADEIENSGPRWMAPLKLT
jgi:glutamate--cysteine ligase